jgi:hypothetical protein
MTDQTNVPKPEQYRNMTNHNQMLDTLASTYTTSYMMKIMNSENKINMRNIFYLLCILSIDDIKTMLKYVILSIKSYIKERITNFDSSYFSISNWINYLSYMLPRKQSNDQIEYEMDGEPYNEICYIRPHIINLNIKVPVLCMLVKHYQNDLGNSLETTDITDISYTDCNNRTTKYTITDFEFEIPETCMVRIANNFSIEFNNDNITGFSKLEESVNIPTDISKLNSVFDLIQNPEIKKDIKKVFNSIHIGKSFIGYTTDTTKPYNILNYLNSDVVTICETIRSGDLVENIYKLFVKARIGNNKKNPQFLTNIFNEILLITVIMSIINKKTNLHDDYMVINNMLYGHLYIPALTIDYKNDVIRQHMSIVYARCNSYFTITTFGGINNITAIAYLNSILQKTNTTHLLKMPTQIDSTSTTSASTSTSDLTIHLTPFQTMQNEDLVNAFNKYMYEMIEKNKVAKPDKQTLYLLKIETETKTTESPNPEYDEYNDKKKVVSDLVDKQEEKMSHTTELYFRDFLAQQCPPRTITNTETICTVVKKEIRKFSKPIDTLYLRQDDKNRLMTILRAFNNRNEIFEELGIPKKLGILAHGVAGTGKTTTILAIADHLNLDVYYVNLNNVRTNSQLKELFDNVVNGNIQNGMIVFEDIDAMTDIVHTRTDNYRNDNTTTILDQEDDALSLSYLLNLLDGTLCQDNTIFVMTTNHKEVLDPAIYRKGRIDIDIEFRKCDHHQIQCIYRNIIKREIPVDVLRQIPEDTFTPADVIFHLIQYIYQRETDECILEPFIGIL